MALVIDQGRGDWRLTGEPLTRVSQAQADTLLSEMGEGLVLDAGASEVRYNAAPGLLLLEMADGRWLEMSEDGSIEDVTRMVMG